jgi:hypothetical protein
MKKDWQTDNDVNPKKDIQEALFRDLHQRGILKQVCRICKKEMFGDFSPLHNSHYECLARR